MLAALKALADEGQIERALLCAGDAVTGHFPGQVDPLYRLRKESCAKQQVTVPDIGGAEGAEVIEVLVAVGDEVSRRSGADRAWSPTRPRWRFRPLSPGQCWSSCW